MTAERPSPGDPGDPGDVAVALLRRAGQRATQPRAAVLAAVVAAGAGHLSAEQVHDRVRSGAGGGARPPVHRATVYRTLEALTGVGVLAHVHLDRGVTAYHLASHLAGSHPVDGAERPPAGTAAAPHLHAQCRRCGEVVDLPADALGDAVERVRAATGFTLDPAHVALSGTCAACATGA